MNTTPENQTPKTGEIWQTSWGYDQTNYDYIIIDEVSKTGKTVKARRARHEEVGHTGQAHIQKPTTEGFGDSFRLSVRHYDTCPKGTYLVGQYPFCDDGKMSNKRRGSFSKVKPGRIFYETDTRFGH